MIRMVRRSDGRLSRDSLQYLSQMAVLTIVTSGEEKAHVVQMRLVGCSGSLRNAMFASMAAFTRYSSVALKLAVWSLAVPWPLTSAQITSHALVPGLSSDNIIPVLCK